MPIKKKEKIKKIRRKTTKKKTPKKTIKKTKKKKGNSKVFKALVIGRRVVSEDKKALDLYGKSYFGQVTGGKVYYSFVEAAYLIDKGKINIYEGRKKLNFDKFVNKARSLEKNFWTRFSVFRDIRNRGYIIRTALKFGADFRIYDRGVKPGKEHARWILFPVYESSSLTWHEFTAKSRVAHSTRKKLLIGIVDEEGDVTYYEVNWVKP
ncbi:MAG: tRNA-intron lyase [Candidatus Pacearchaeota archaeon]|nr:MAG: tRNA-intron lyase [Candidatus Pacearchaeota archaeon]